MLRVDARSAVEYVGAKRFLNITFLPVGAAAAHYAIVYYQCNRTCAINSMLSDCLSTPSQLNEIAEQKTLLLDTL